MEEDTMTYPRGFLPADLRIVSEADLWLVQHRTAVSADPSAAADRRSLRPPWPEGALERVLDEVDRRAILGDRRRAPADRSGATAGGRPHAARSPRTVTPPAARSPERSRSTTPGERWRH